MSYVSNRKLVPISVTLDPADIALLDRLAALDETSRSAALRTLLAGSRAALIEMVGILEDAVQARESLDETLAESVLTDFLPELQKLSNMMLATSAAIEGQNEAAEAGYKRGSNHGR